jgi:hypothetical protein
MNLFVFCGEDKETQAAIIGSLAMLSIRKHGKSGSLSTDPWREHCENCHWQHSDGDLVCNDEMRHRIVALACGKTPEELGLNDQKISLQARIEQVERWILQGCLPKGD